MESSKADQFLEILGFWIGLINSPPYQNRGKSDRLTTAIKYLNFYRYFNSSSTVKLMSLAICRNNLGEISRPL